MQTLPNLISTYLVVSPSLPLNNPSPGHSCGHSSPWNLSMYSYISQNLNVWRSQSLLKCLLMQPLCIAQYISSAHEALINLVNFHGLCDPAYLLPQYLWTLFRFQYALRTKCRNPARQIYIQVTWIFTGILPILETHCNSYCLSILLPQLGTDLLGAHSALFRALCLIPTNACTLHKFMALLIISNVSTDRFSIYLWPTPNAKAHSNLCQPQQLRSGLLYTATWPAIISFKRSTIAYTYSSFFRTNIFVQPQEISILVSKQYRTLAMFQVKKSLYLCMSNSLYCDASFSTANWGGQKLFQLPLKIWFPHWYHASSILTLLDKNIYY